MHRTPMWLRALVAGILLAGAAGIALLAPDALPGSDADHRLLGLLIWIALAMFGSLFVLRLTRERA